VTVECREPLRQHGMIGRRCEAFYARHCCNTPSPSANIGDHFMQKHRRWMGLCTELLSFIYASMPACDFLYCPSFLHRFCFFRSTAISNQARSANMSDQSSSDNTSSVTDSSRTTRPSRPAHDRNQSYTHVFPASSAVSKPKKPSKRKADPPCLAAPTQIQDENTRLLFGGLQWLLDASVKSQDSNKTRVVRESSEPLSERAITSFNAEEDVNIDKSLKPAKTAAWIDGQRRIPAAPPF